MEVESLSFPPVVKFLELKFYFELLHFELLHANKVFFDVATFSAEIQIVFASHHKVSTFSPPTSSLTLQMNIIQQVTHICWSRRAHSTWSNAISPRLHPGFMWYLCQYSTRSWLLSGCKLPKASIIISESVQVSLLLCLKSRNQRSFDALAPTF